MRAMAVSPDDGKGAFVPSLWSGSQMAPRICGAGMGWAASLKIEWRERGTPSDSDTTALGLMKEL